MTAGRAGGLGIEREGGAEAQPQVLVLLAAYNGVDFLEPQMDSILVQKGVDVRVVVSVDRSVDGTREWFGARYGDDSRVRLRPDAGRFGSASANFFSLMSEAVVDDVDFVALADQDDVWLPTKLTRAVQVMTDTGAAGYSASVWTWFSDGSVRRLNKAGRQRKWDHLFSSPGPGCTHVLRADVFLRLQATLREHQDLLSGIEYHDWVDYAFVRQQGLRWHIDPVPQMLYRQHAANQLGANSGLRAKLVRARHLREGWMWQQARLICEVVGAEESPPYRLLRRGSLASRLALAGLSPLCRRQLRDAAALAVSFLMAPKESAR